MQDWIQAIASIVMVIVTIVYVRHTKQLVEQSSNCYLGIEDIDFPKVRGCEIYIMNYGPSNALDIAVCVEMISLAKILENERDRVRLITATGPKALPINREGKYEITDNTYTIQDNTKILVYNATHTGKEVVHQWTYSPDVGAEFVGEVNKESLPMKRQNTLS